MLEIGWEYILQVLFLPALKNGIVEIIVVHQVESKCLSLGFRLFSRPGSVVGGVFHTGASQAIEQGRERQSKDLGCKLELINTSTLSKNIEGAWLAWVSG